MIDYQSLYQCLNQAKAGPWVELIPRQINQAFSLRPDSRLRQWLNMLEQIPDITPSICDLNTDWIQIGSSSQLSIKERKALTQQLKFFQPWRKGPYSIFGISIDSEWRADFKFNRLKEHILPLRNKLVLDVGCGNGYHCWRMLGMGAKMVIGIDPLITNVIQFQALKKLYGAGPIYVLPIKLEQIKPAPFVFDSVFSMGVLYHRRSPIDHLMELKNCLKPSGELILETLVIDGKLGEVLVPEGRYAQMRNVWFLPSCKTLLSWLKRCGFKNSRVLNISTTSSKEQRTTEWMGLHSLADFLHPKNQTLTCEGLPAPKRAIVLANTV